MIENIRKYNGLIILGLVVIGLGLVLTMQSSPNSSLAGGRPYIKIAGKTYTDQEFQKYGVDSMEVIQSMARSGDFNLFQFLIGLTSRAQTRDQQAEQFFIGRMLLRNAKEDFGVKCTEDEITNFIKSLATFSGPQQEFDPEAYKMFLERGIGRLGMTERDLRELAEDIIAFDKISELVGAGLLPHEDAIAHKLALDSQSISGSIALMDIEPFEKSVEPTDQELKSYWEVIQDAYMTEPKRKFTYVIATPNMPEEPTAEVEEEKEETIADAVLTPEQKAAKEKAKADAKAKKDAKFAEEKRKAQRATDELFATFTNELEDNLGNNFEELAKEYGFEVKTSELFAKSNPPADLDTALRSSSSTGRAVDELFKIIITTDPISKISPPIAIGENQWLIARLEEEEKSRVKTFEEAQEEVIAQYIDEKSVDALREAAEKANTAIQEALAAGKSFESAAKAQGVESVSTFENFTQTSQAQPYTQPRNLFQAARDVDPGSLAEPVIEPSSAYIIFVQDRKWIQSDNVSGELDLELTSTVNQNSRMALTDWIGTQTEAAKVQRLYKQP